MILIYYKYLLTCYSKIFMVATVISPHSIERADLFIEIQSRTFYRPPSQMYIYMCRWIFEQDYLTCKYACCTMVFQGKWYTNKKWMHLYNFVFQANPTKIHSAFFKFQYLFSVRYLSWPKLKKLLARRPLPLSTLKVYGALKLIYYCSKIFLVFVLYKN